MRYFLLTVRPALPRLFFLFVILLLAGSGRGWAQAPAFTQAVSLNSSGGTGILVSRAVATDAAGNQYVTGNFNATLVLGSTTLVSAGYEDVFVAKRSAATGAWLWAVRAGGRDGDMGYAIAVDGRGNALVTGSFYATARFGAGTGSIDLVSSGLSNVFVAKFDAGTGACAWAVQTGGSGASTGIGLAVDAGGNAVVTGNIQGTASFDTSPAPTTLVAGGSYGAFVAKFGAGTGACAWAVQAGPTSNTCAGTAVAVDAGGNAVVTGYFYGSVSFATSPVPTVLSVAGGSNIFVAKFGAGTGACTWAVQAGGSMDNGYGVAVDAGGNALVTGTIQGTASFGTRPTPTALVATGRSDVFVARFDASTGICTWAVRAGGINFDESYGVAADAGGNALVTGCFADNATFATSPAPTSLASAGDTDVFVAKFGARTGACAWAVRAGGTARDCGYGVAVDANGHLTVTGFFEDIASFGSLPALVSSSGPPVSAGFVAVLAGAGTLPTATPAALPTFTLYPNPAHTTCQIQGAAAGATVTLLDALGRPLARALADASGTARLALPAGLAPGLYLVRSGGQLRRLAVE